MLASTQRAAYSGTGNAGIIRAIGLCGLCFGASDLPHDQAYRIRAHRRRTGLGL